MSQNDDSITGAENVLKFLFREIRYLKGIGPNRAKMLQEHNIASVFDLFFYVPRKYLDRSEIKRIGELSEGETTTVIGRVGSSGIVRGRRRLFKMYIHDDTDTLELVWFSGFKYLEGYFSENDVLAVTGKIGYYNGFQITHPEFEVISGVDSDPVHTRRIIPIYPETAALKQIGLHSRGLRKVIKQALEELSNIDFETLPSQLRNRIGLTDLRDAIIQIHFPESANAAENGRQRLAFEELFYLELLLAARHQKRISQEPGIAFPDSGKLDKKIISSLGFKLTGAQKRVLAEIKRDMAKPHPMNRLIQGDVGSGKTIVAVLAMLNAVEAGYQAALMVPTEILAVQHGQSLSTLLKGLNIKIEILTGGMSAPARRKALQRLKDGTSMIIVGTHALIQESVVFDKLGMVVIDEQHKFGVVQREDFIKKGWNPDRLTMTATPIPRTLAMSVYGDLDISIIDEKPPGRKSVKTSFVPYEKRNDMYRFIRDNVKKGKQVFIVYPLVEESDKIDLKAAKESFEKLKTEIFPDLKLELIHGRMKNSEKNRIMLEFKNGSINIIVSTTVIEVGVDILNANIMVVENAERFGLSQLHQLRGRIGRGRDQAFCLLLSDKSLSKEAEARLKIMCASSDGFKIAEADMAIRGPGEIMGTRQHGLPELRVATLTDYEMLKLARDAAFKIVTDDPLLIKPENRLLRQVLLLKYKDKIKYSKIA